MKASTSRCAAAFLLALCNPVVGHGASQADADPNVLANRRAARAAYDVAGDAPPTVIVDGAPRALPGATPPVFPGITGSRGGTPSRYEHHTTSLLTVTDEASMADDLGGDDIIIASSPDLDSRAFMVRAQSGAYFVGVVALGDLYLYRSTDAGESWTLWSTLDLTTGFSASACDMVIADAVPNQRLFWSFTVSGVVFVAFADITTAVPSWTIVTAMTDVSITFADGASIATDYPVYGAYYIYVAAQGIKEGRRHIYFSRSLDQGTSYQNEYVIEQSLAGSNEMYAGARIAYGFGGNLHVAYRVESDDASAAGARYRRAVSFADAGAAAWGAAQTLLPVVTGANAAVYDLSASLTSNGVYALLFRSGPGSIQEIHYSSDTGVTWPLPNVVAMPLGGGMAPLPLLGGDLVYPRLGVSEATPAGYYGELYLLRSTEADPSAWSAGERMSRGYTQGTTSCTACLRNLVPDPSFGDRLAISWVQLDEVSRNLRFDAEWRRDPGYPNTDVGFPISIPGGHGQTPPAVAEVDGDPEKEIVFATTTGLVYVVNHDGTNVPGWPVDIGTGIPYDAPVAVGDLVGNGVPSVVTGDANGLVYAFDPSGELLPGWPVDLETASDVFVSIGALGPPSTRYVVALSYKTVAILNYQGMNVAPAWNPAQIPFGVYEHSAAIGDVDNDGIAEIVSVAGPNIYYHELNEPLFTGRQFAGENFSDSPSLADIENDGDLEVAIPSGTGKMFLIDPDGLDVPGWPVTIGSSYLTSAAMANILGTGETELIVAENGGPVHVRYSTGVEQTGYPLSTGGPNFMGAIAYPVNISGSNVNIGSPLGNAYSWRNIPSNTVPGWPRNLPGGVEETFAAGDIDNDGRAEIVVLGLDYLTVFDVGVAPPTDPRRYWPMYAHDAQRTGCLDCDEILTGAGDTPGVSRATALDVHPNPFNPVTTIEYDVAAAGKVSLEIFDVTGKRVATLIDNERRDAGHYSLTYAATGASGVYFARLRTADGEVTRKIVLLK